MHPHRAPQPAGLPTPKARIMRTPANLDASILYVKDLEGKEISLFP
jgi:hypothetical protein